MTVVSREGIEVKEYRLFELILALPFALALETCLFIWSRLLRKRPVEGYDNVPQNAIIYAYHGDIYLTALTLKFWNLLKGRKFCYLSFHGFVPYLWIISTYAYGLLACRYDRKRGIKPMDYVRDYLKSYDGLFFIRTDSGGPYGKVRGSLIKLARETNRPLVPYRQFSSRKIIIKSHQLPIPGATIISKYGTPIFPSELEGLNDDVAIRKLQSHMDALEHGTVSPNVSTRVEAGSVSV